ncbi:hypothetical protein GEMRC1_012405 [Eukaryota sp. GEM-RC1]
MGNEPSKASSEEVISVTAKQRPQKSAHADSLSRLPVAQRLLSLDDSRPFSSLPKPYMSSLKVQLLDHLEFFSSSMTDIAAIQDSISPTLHSLVSSTLRSSQQIADKKRECSLDLLNELRSHTKMINQDVHKVCLKVENCLRLIDESSELIKIAADEDFESFGSFLKRGKELLDD